MWRALFLRCLLVLALVAQGLPASAMDAHVHGDAAAMAAADQGDAPMADCHGDEPAPTPPSAATPDCCLDDGMACRCDCLHAPTLVATTMRPLPGVAPRKGEPPLRLEPGIASPAPLPSLRPPIA